MNKSSFEEALILINFKLTAHAKSLSISYIYDLNVLCVYTFAIYLFALDADVTLRHVRIFCDSEYRKIFYQRTPN
jgi:hypothetical protein